MEILMIAYNVMKLKVDLFLNIFQEELEEIQELLVKLIDQVMKFTI